MRAKAYTPHWLTDLLAMLAFLGFMLLLWVIL